MNIGIHINDNDMKNWLINAGFKTEMREVTEFVSAYHNRTEQRTFDRLHVLNENGKWMPADQFAALYLKRVIFNIN